MPPLTALPPSHNLASASRWGRRTLTLVALEALPDFGKVESLKLRQSKLSGVATAALLKKVPNVEMVDLSVCNSIDLEDIETLPNFEKLESLDLESSKFSGANILALLKKTPNIKTVQSDESSRINLQALKALPAFEKFKIQTQVRHFSLTIKVLR